MPTFDELVSSTMKRLSYLGLESAKRIVQGQLLMEATSGACFDCKHYRAGEKCNPEALKSAGMNVIITACYCGSNQLEYRGNL